MNVGWLKTAQIPGDASSSGAFQELRENSRNPEHQLFRYEFYSVPQAPLGMGAPGFQ